MVFSSKYKPHELESAVQTRWYNLDNTIYNWRGDSVERKDNFVIDTPPPTVSGSLHIGHVFSYTQSDFMARFWRMMGKDVFYPIGFDDNGLPSERLVEKVNKVRASQMKRSEFQDLCVKTIEKYELEFEALFKQCGISFDWRYKYQTVSPQSVALSQMSFIDLFNKDFIERKKAPTFWDWIDQTAIAQAEIEDKTRDSMMNHIYFGVLPKDSDSNVVDASTTDQFAKKLEIATTRPELLPACSAVFYHPEDSRYKGLAGRFAIVPVFGKIVPILPDEDVEMDKGSGLVMCCTYGDFQDVVWQQRHNLPIHHCVGFNGRMQNAGPFTDMKIKAARLHAVELLEQGGFVKEKIGITQTVKCAERSGEVLEIIPTDQWYIKLMPYKDQLHEQINKCKWNPNFMKQRAEIWNDNLNQNWCISRQRYFGVPIPVWYSKRVGEEGKVILPDVADLPVDPMHDLPKGYSADEVIAEKDVLDTWATSSITPSLASGIINEKYYIDGYRSLDSKLNGVDDKSGNQISANDRITQLMPCDLRPQSHEIIRTWGYYTIAKSLIHNGRIPWYDLAISGWCLAHDNSKMSKSKGNTIDPKKLLDEYGADVVRYWASTSKLGVDIAFSEDTLKVGKKLTRKIWNAAKFAHSQLELAGLDCADKVMRVDAMGDSTKKSAIFEGFDLWIISKLSRVIEESTELLKGYDFAAARSKIEDFFWKDFCDNYLEIVKKRSYGSGRANQTGGEDTIGSDSKSKSNNIDPSRASALYGMRYCMKILLRLFMPYIPHITSEIYSYMFENDAMQVTPSWPQPDEYKIDEISKNSYISQGDRAISIVEATRKEKTMQQVAMNAPLADLKYSVKDMDMNVLDMDDSFKNDILDVTNSDSLISNDSLEYGSVIIRLKTDSQNCANRS